MKSLKEFQEANCNGCFYADTAKVGTERVCCTYLGLPRIEGGKCLTRKEVKKSDSPGGEGTGAIKREAMGSETTHQSDCSRPRRL